MSKSSAFAVTADGELMTLEGTQERKNNFSLAAIKLQPLTRMSPEEIQEVKTRDPDTR